jgi:hypothetical protein
MTHPSIPTLWLVLLGLSITPLQAEVYKWQDDSGETHYSQTPPPGVPASRLRLHGTPSHAGQPDPRLKESLEAFDKRRQQDQEAGRKRAEAAQQAELRKQNCARARSNLQTLQSHGQIKLKEGDAYRMLSEEERQAKIAEAQQQIDEFCTQ